MWIEREAERHRIEAALRDVRLVELHGGLGVGKTSLAARLSWSGPRRELSLAVRSASSAERAVAAALRLVAHDSRTLSRALAARDGELVVVDDAELVASLAPVLLETRARGATVLLISRVPLGVARSIELRPLGARASAALLSGFGVRGGGEAIAALVARCGGLPLPLAIARSFLGELDPRAVLEAFDGSLTLPDGTALSALVARAVARLPERDRAALAALAVFRETFTASEAAAALGVSPPRALEACRRLLALGMITSRARYGVTRLALADPLAELHEDSRRALPAAVADAIVRSGEDALGFALSSPSEEAWSRLALEEPNLVRVVELARSAPLRERAATAIHRLRATLGPLRVPAAVSRVRATRAPLALARGELARLSGDHAGARRDVAFALERAPRGSALEAEARRRIAQLARIEGASPLAAAEIDRAIALYRELGDRRGEAQCVAEEAFALAARGRFDEAAARQRTALALLDREGTGSERATARSYLAVHLHRAGRLAEAEVLHRRALAEHVALGAARYAAAEEMHLGYVAHELGREADAVAALERARAAQRALGDAGLEALSCVYLARVYADEGRVSDGEQLVAEANVLLRGVSAPAQHASAELVLGHLAMGRSAFRVAADAYASAQRRVRTPTVGFEALTGAYLAAALYAAGERGAKLRKALRASERMLRGVRHPFLPQAYAILDAFVRGEPHEPPLPEAIASSSEVRRALRFTRTSELRPFKIDGEGRFALTPEGRRVDLSRRRALRLLLLALVDGRRRRPGVALGIEELVGAGWPGERLRPTAADQRVYTAIWTLRRDLLGEALLRRDDGYLLRPDADFEKV